MSRSHSIRASAAIIALALLGTGVAGLQNAGASTTRAAAVAAPTGDIVATAQSAGQFTVLLEAATAAGLVDALKAPGPLTVFAPTDAAFTALLAKLGKTKDQLLADKALLTKVLTYHVLSGKVLSSDITTTLRPTTLEGDKLTIVPTDGKVVINGVATVTTADVLATNGVIHVIDQVLIPPTPAPAPAPTNTIVDVAQGAGQFGTLLAAAKAAGLVDALSGPGPLTVFAPTDKAFAILLRRLHTTPAKLLADPVKLAKILKYHVVSGRILSTDLKRRNVVTTLNGRKIVVRVLKGRHTRVTVNGTAHVIKADILASNGVIHVIDRVLIPRG